MILNNCCCRVQILNLLRLVKLQSMFGCGMDYYFQFEAKPSGAADHTLKIEGSVYEQFFPTQASWPVTCRLVGPNSQRFVPLLSANSPLALQRSLLHFSLNKFKISLSIVLGSVGSYFIVVTNCFLVLFQHII